jgi:L-ornithine N5-oxygenase
VVEHLPSGERTTLTADAIVFTTGYRPVDATRLLGAAGHHVQGDSESLLRIGRDYRLVTDSRLRAGLYLQGGTGHAHGITSTLLSAFAVRSGEIMASIAVGDRAPEPDHSIRPLAMIGDR